MQLARLGVVRVKPVGPVIMRDHHGHAVVDLADIVGRTVAEPRELPVGAMMALIGAPVFIVLLRRQTR